jgi:hypothetical protein
MGWDGYACRVQRDDWLKEDVLERLNDTDPALRDFQEAAERAGLEFSLQDAHLCCRDTARMLARGTGEDPYNREWWPDKVKELARTARWDFAIGPEDAGSRDSARLFLELCAKHSLGIRFD